MFDVTKKGCVTGIYLSSGTTVSFYNRAILRALDLDLGQTANKTSFKKMSPGMGGMLVSCDEGAMFSGQGTPILYPIYCNVAQITIAYKYLRQIVLEKVVFAPTTVHV